MTGSAHEGLLSRRALLGAGCGLAMAGARAKSQGSPQALLRTGGVVVAFRHAAAPGSFDPPEFQLGNCRTQRNLSAEGRLQARRMGEWFARHRLHPAHVRSSPWCRCIDTATLAFGAPEVWPALGSPYGDPETTGARHLQELRAALEATTRQPGRFEVWVTHMFVLQDLAGAHTSSGEGLLLQAQPSGSARVLARLSIA